MGDLNWSCIDHDVHQAGDTVECMEEDAEHEALCGGVGDERVKYSPVYKTDEQGCCGGQVLETPG